VCCSSRCVGSWRQQRTAAHCNTLQHTAKNHYTLQQLPYSATHYNTLQLTATHCNTLQHTTTHCTTLHHTATQCTSLQLTAAENSGSVPQQPAQRVMAAAQDEREGASPMSVHIEVEVCCSVLQCVAVCCRYVAVCCSVLHVAAQEKREDASPLLCLYTLMLKCVLVCCNVLWCVAGVLQCVAVCCSVLQCVAACCSVAAQEKREGASPMSVHIEVEVCCRVFTMLQCVACVLQCVAVC